MPASQGDLDGFDRTAYEVCGSCCGSGLQNGLDGPVSCWSCGGEVMVRVRDERGRFATREVR